MSSVMLLLNPKVNGFGKCINNTICCGENGVVFCRMLSKYANRGVVYESI